MTETATTAAGAETATTTDAATGTGTTATGAATEQATGNQSATTLESVQAELAAARADAETWKARSRTNEGRNKARAEALKKVSVALGLETELDPADPAVFTAKLEAAERASKGAARELAVLRAAGRLDADGDALLDSRGFIARIADLDPTDTEGIKAAIVAAVAQEPARYGRTAASATGSQQNGQQQAATTQQHQASTTASGGQFNGASGGQRQWTKADLDRATPAEVNKAMKAGLLASYLAS